MLTTQNQITTRATDNIYPIITSVSQNGHAKLTYDFGYNVGENLEDQMNSDVPDPIPVPEDSTDEMIVKRYRRRVVQKREINMTDFDRRFQRTYSLYPIRNALFINDM